jgi:hypothetical protein
VTTLTASETGIREGDPCPHGDGILSADPDVAGFVSCPVTGQRFLADGGLLALADQVAGMVRREREREQVFALITGAAGPRQRPRRRLSVVREAAAG